MFYSFPALVHAFDRRFKSLRAWAAERARQAAESIKAIADGLDGRKAQDGERGQTGSKERPWADDAPEYLPNSEAVKLAEGNPDIKELGRLLIPEGDMRYMRKGQRCKVHLADFRRYLRDHKPSEVPDEMIDEFLRDVEERKGVEDRRKGIAR